MVFKLYNNCMHYLVSFISNLWVSSSKEFWLTCLKMRQEKLTLCLIYLIFIYFYENGNFCLLSVVNFSLWHDAISWNLWSDNIFFKYVQKMHVSLQLCPFFVVVHCTYFYLTCIFLHVWTGNNTSLNIWSYVLTEVKHLFLTRILTDDRCS